MIAYNTKIQKIKTLYNKYKNTLLPIIVIVFGIFLLFYWTHLFFKIKIENIKNNIATKKEQIIKANEAYQQFIINSKKQRLQVTGGLLSFMQIFGRSLKLEQNMTSLKPKPTNIGSEGISVRIEQLTLNDIVEILTQLDKYNNLNIEVFNLTKRFDNPKRADIYLEINKL
jgi:amino acid permease